MDFIFACLLFVAYFSFGCSLIANPVKTTPIATTTPEAIAPEPIATTTPEAITPEPIATTTPEAITPEPIATTTPEAITPEPIATTTPEAIAPELIATTTPEAIAPEPIALPLLSPPDPMTTLSEPIASPAFMPEFDVDGLKVREARKIAKALGIKQKVNGKAQPLSFLKCQIKAKLTELDPEVLESLNSILSA